MKIAIPFPGRSPAPTRERRRISARGVIALLLVLALVGGGVVFWRSRVAGPAAPTVIPAPVTRGDLVINVESSGAVASSNARGLSFTGSGVVEEVLVKLGERVTAGQPLARLDDAELRLKLQQAEAALATAQAKLDQTKAGNATEQDIAQAKANLASAQAQLQKTQASSAGDIRNAEATLRSAQAQFDALKNPSPDKISAAQLKLTQAEETLNKTRASTAAAKEQARETVEQSANALRNAQDTLSRITWETRNADGSWKVGENDPGYQSVVDSYNEAERTVRNAESKLRQAHVDYDSARQQESASIQEAQAQVNDARAQLNALMNPNQAAITQAQAAVDQAQARLDTLRKGGAAGDISSAQAQVDQSRAALEELTAPSSSSDIAIAQAGVTDAQAKLDAAKRELEQTTLVAPADGTVAALGIEIGDTASAGSTAVTLINDNTLHVDLNVSETDISQVEVGQTAQITFDALEDVTATGTVESVAPIANEGQNTVSYRVRVSFERGEAPIKVGMTANARIEVEKHTGAIQVPTRAITTRGPSKTIDVYTGNGEETATVQVETGATDGSMTEIVSCTEIGKQCLREGDRVAMKLTGAAGVQGTSSGDMITVFQAGQGGPAPSGAQPRIVVGP